MAYTAQDFIVYAGNDRVLEFTVEGGEVTAEVWWGCTDHKAAAPLLQLRSTDPEQVDIEDAGADGIVATVFVSAADTAGLLDAGQLQRVLWHELLYVDDQGNRETIATGRMVVQASIFKGET